MTDMAIWHNMHADNWMQQAKWNELMKLLTKCVEFNIPLDT